MIGFKIDFLMIWGGFWGGFGRVWDTKLDQKINKKSIWKDDEIFGGILEASWWHLGGILETFGGIWSENQKKYRFWDPK